MGVRVMLKSIWLTPPLAFGRVGASPVPSDAFMWGRDDLRPEGTGRTTLQLIDTFLDAKVGDPLRPQFDQPRTSSDPKLHELADRMQGKLAELTAALENASRDS
jgi:hypothetical protein